MVVDWDVKQRIKQTKLEMSWLTLRVFCFSLNLKTVHVVVLSLLLTD